MRGKVRFSISLTALVCQLFLLKAGLWAQPPLESAPSGSVLLRADSQQKTGNLYHLAGHVEIQFAGMQLTADRVDYDSATGELEAAGNVQFTRPAQNEDFQASRAEYNLRKGTGSFFEVRGSVGGLVRTGPSLLTTTNPLYFEAERVDRLDENTYRVRHGTVTVCSPTNPTWTFSVAHAIIRPGGGAWLYQPTFRLWDVPVLYIPVFYRSLRRIPRSSGFLMPTIGNNSRQGLIIGESFFWAINRSMDLELGAAYLSKRGWSQHATFRMRPTAGSYLDATFLGVVDRGFGPRNVDQGGQTVHVEGVAQLPRGFRGVVNVNYLSSLTFREAFAQTFTEAVNSELHSTGFVSKNFGSYSFNVLSSRFENFQSIRPKDTVVVRHLPLVEFNSMPRPLWTGAPVWFSWDSAAGAVSRSEPAPPSESRRRTSTLERLEFYPRLTLPLRWKGVGLTTNVGYRATQYGAQQTEGRISGESWFRGAREIAFRLDLPALSRVFSGAGPLSQQPFEHRIEPKVIFRSRSGAKDFSRVLLFDERDLITDTEELEYSLTHRFLMRREGVPGAREVFSWELRQQYYFDPTFGGALVPGRRNVFRTTLDLTGNAFLDGPRRVSPVVSIFRFRPFTNYDIEVREDYDTVRHRFSHGGLVANARWGDAFASVSHFFVRSSEVLAEPSNQLRFLFGYGNLDRAGLNAAFAATYDIRGAFLQFSAVQISYNNDCCGISFEFRRFALGSVRNENQFRVAFSLANIGTFGTLKKQERLF